MALVFSLLASCSSPKKIETVVSEFPINEDLKGERIDLALPEYLANMFDVAGDYYVFNAIRSKYCFQIYDKDFNLVDTIIRIGGGPNEIPGGAVYLGQWSGEDTDPSILVYANGNGHLLEFPIRGRHELTAAVSLQGVKGIYPNSVYRAGSDLFYGLNLGLERGADMFSYNSGTKDVAFSTPAFQFNPDLSLFYATQQSMAIDTVSRRLCTAYINYPVFDIYDFDFNLVRKVYIGDKIDTESVLSGDSYPGLIHAGYHKGNILMIYSESDEKNRRLLVFTPDGEPVASYGIGDAMWYAVDDRHDRILTTNYDKELDVVYLMQYPIPERI